MDIAQGFKTFFGIAVMAFAALSQTMGWDWWGQISGQVETVGNQIAGLIGSGIALWGAIMKVRREKALKAELAAKEAA